jgi:hypothetical protein
MKTKILILIYIVSTFIFEINSFTLGSYCSNKTILNSDSSLIYDSFADHKEAFNNIASCALLHSDLDTACCYIKAKFRNRAADKKYTHRGCIQITEANWGNIDNFIGETESKIANDENIDKVDVEIDCNSKFIKLTALVLFAFLL